MPARLAACRLQRCSGSVRSASHHSGVGKDDCVDVVLQSGNIERCRNCFQMAGACIRTFTCRQAIAMEWSRKVSLKTIGMHLSENTSFPAFICFFDVGRQWRDLHGTKYRHSCGAQRSFSFPKPVKTKTMSWAGYHVLQGVKAMWRRQVSGSATGWKLSIPTLEKRNHVSTRWCVADNDQTTDRHCC